MSRHRSPGRRRAPGAVRRLPDGFRRLSAAYAVKSVAGVAVVGGAATMLVLPVNADPDSLALATPEARAVDGRDATAALTASRSRGTGPPEVAVTAPAGAGPTAPAPVGVGGVKAVAKPTPKPKPPPKSAPASSGSSDSTTPSSGGSSSYSGGVSSYCADIGVDQNAAILCSAIRAEFGNLTVGGYRPNAGEHSTGEAIDIMTSDRALGDAISDFVIANASKFDVEYLIWRQRYRPIPGSWESMEDRGGATANHYDHVHVTVN
ncbi:MAG: hypothetical protein ACRCSN_18640 [Dermatophilaceae bacterium]